MNKIKGWKAFDENLKCRVTDQLEMMGYTILTVGKHTANGPDIVAINKFGTAINIEKKKARKTKRSFSVHPVEKNRRSDHLIAIQFPSGYVLIEPMKDHLKACAKGGSRCFYGIY